MHCAARSTNAGESVWERNVELWIAVLKTNWMILVCVMHHIAVCRAGQGTHTRCWKGGGVAYVMIKDV